MLIVLGGFLGSGRSGLARLLASKAGFYYYSLHEKKMHHLSLDENRRIHERIMEPGTDALRMRMYREALKEFPMISKMHENVIVDDAFHRAQPRGFFLKEARAYFNPVVFVWVESPDETVEPRLRIMEHNGVITSVTTALRRRKQVIKEFEPFASRPLVFFHRISDERAAEALYGFIQLCIKRGFATD